MFRDKSPLTNLGYGLTSRDVPAASNESEKPNPNSGFISRALNDRPVLKYISTMAAMLAGSYAGSKVLSKGGLKLAKTIQDAADGGSHIGRKFVDTAAQIRRTLDELEGVNRFVEGHDNPYSQLVFESDGKILKPQLIKVSGPEFVSDGSMWMTRGEFAAANSGREPVAQWAFRDQLQSNLVRTTRSLGTMLPATYVTQRSVIDPMFGNNEDKPKVKWYNPVDVVTDFVKQSTINITGFILPQAAAGAGFRRLKQLADLPYHDSPLPYTKGQMKTANKIADIKTILTSFGQDAEKLFNQANRISVSATYAMNNSYREASKKESGVVFAMHQARRGAKAARVSSELSGESKLQTALNTARGFAFGYKNPKSSGFQIGLDKTGKADIFKARESTLGFVDLIPSLRGSSARSKRVHSKL